VAQLPDRPLAETTGKIDELQAQGIAVICYISAGSFEDWRKDRQLFRPEEIGKPLGDWPGERWLDIRSKNVLAVMATRLDRAVRAGCDAVEPDNLDGYQHDTGFSFTADDQIAYLHELVQLAHQRDLSIGLKNAVGLIRPGNLASHFDWALNEECYTYNECDLLRPFIDNNKAVFIAQYADKPVAAQCRHAKYNRFNLSYYDPDYLLNGSQYLVCPE